MNYTIVFFTHSGAIKFDKKMNKLNVPCSLQPIPRKISSSCGICAKIHYEGEIENLLEEEVHCLYRELSKNHYELLYESQ